MNRKLWFGTILTSIGIMSAIAGILLLVWGNATLPPLSPADNWCTTINITYWWVPISTYLMEGGCILGAVGGVYLAYFSLKGEPE